MRGKEGAQDQIILEGKIFAVLSYLFILCIIPLLLKKDNNFVLSHGKQGLVLFVGEVALFIASIVVPGIIKPGIFVFGILSLWGIVESLRGHYIKLPFVFEISEKISL